MDLNAQLVSLLNRSIFSNEVFSLIRLGANPDVLNDSGYSLLHILIFNRRMDEAFELIKDNHANINVKDKFGHPPLYYMLNVTYKIDDLMKMIRLGANPNTRTKSGMAPIHMLICSNFKYALELLEKHPASIHFKNSEGTPIQLLLNNRHTHPSSADDYINLVRCGADPESVDKEGISLLTALLELDRPESTKEFVVLTQVSPQERIYYTPLLTDYLVDEDGIMQLVSDLEKNHISTPNIARLAKFPLAKEKVIEYIKSLNPDNKEILLKECLSPKSSLNQFFSVQRGWFMTSNQRGTLAQLKSMQQELINNRISESQETVENIENITPKTSMRRTTHFKLS